MPTHRINLKGPWDYQPLAPADSDPQSDLQLPPSGTIKFPASWQAALGDFRGSAKFTRRFNRPSNLIQGDRIDIILDGVGGTSTLSLNQHLIGTIPDSQQTARFEITSLLQPHNVLEITVHWLGPATEPGGLWGPIALEIHSDNVDWIAPDSPATVGPAPTEP